MEATASNAEAKQQALPPKRLKQWKNFELSHGRITSKEVDGETTSHRRDMEDETSIANSQDANMLCFSTPIVLEYLKNMDLKLDLLIYEKKLNRNVKRIRNIRKSVIPSKRTKSQSRRTLQRNTSSRYQNEYNRRNSNTSNKSSPRKDSTIVSNQINDNKVNENINSTAESTNVPIDNKAIPLINVNASNGQIEPKMSVEVAIPQRTRGRPRKILGQSANQYKPKEARNVDAATIIASLDKYCESKNKANKSSPRKDSTIVSNQISNNKDNENINSTAESTNVPLDNKAIPLINVNACIGQIEPKIVVAIPQKTRGRPRKILGQSPNQYKPKKARNSDAATIIASLDKYCESKNKASRSACKPRISRYLNRDSTT